MSDQNWPSTPGEGSDPSGGGPEGSPPPPSAPPPSGAPAGGGPAGGGTDPRTGLPYAEFGQRVLAVLIDVAVFMAIFIVLAIVGSILSAISDVLGVLFFILAYIAGFAFSLAYIIGSEGGPLAQTFGKHMMGIRVVGPATGPIGYGKAGIRYLGRILDSIVCGIPIGLLWPLFDDENRTWHDMVADTRVVVSPTPEKSFNYWMSNVRG